MTLLGSDFRTELVQYSPKNRGADRFYCSVAFRTSLLEFLGPTVGGRRRHPESMVGVKNCRRSYKPDGKLDE
jgi:hypothetical protein